MAQQVRTATTLRWKKPPKTASVSVSSNNVLFAGTAEPVGVKNNGDGTHTVHYTPAQDGPYTVAVKYAEQEVPHRYNKEETRWPPCCRYGFIEIPLCLARFERGRFIKFSALRFSLFC